MTDSPDTPTPPRRRWNAGRPLLEVVLIALGVFLGLAGEQWRERAARRERADEALRRIRAELAANREEVRRVADYHVDAQQRLTAYFAMPAAKRAAEGFSLEGIQPAQFEHTAWQLAQDIQALVDIDPELSFALARVYGVQSRYIGLSTGITQAMYLRPPSDDLAAFLRSLALYYSDIVVLEPALEKMYGDLLPRLDRALDH